MFFRTRNFETESNDLTKGVNRNANTEDDSKCLACAGSGGVWGSTMLFVREVVLRLGFLWVFWGWGRAVVLL